MYVICFCFVTYNVGISIMCINHSSINTMTTEVEEDFKLILFYMENGILLKMKDGIAW